MRVAQRLQRLAVSDMYDLVAVTIRATCDGRAIAEERRRGCELSRPISARVSTPANLSVAEGA
jgi:hypothetical protein